MKKRVALFTPGPTNLDKRVLQSFQQEVIHHRGKEFQTLYPSLCQQLKDIFQTKSGETLILTGSGTLGLDAGLASLLKKGDQVLALSNGYFGERFIQMADQYGLDVIALHQPWTTSFDAKVVKQLVREYPDLKAILVVYSETSTGSLQDLKALGKIAKAANLLLIVDAISGLLYNDFRFDEWQVDYAVSSSQKGFGLPPGLAFVCMSQKALQHMHAESINYYISLKDNLLFLQKYKTTPSTPAVHMIQATKPVFDHILQQGIDTYQKRGKTLVRKLVKELAPLGFTPLIADDKQRAKGVVGFYLPPGIQSGDLQTYLRDQHYVLIAVGIEHMASQVIRVGTMSRVTPAETKRLIDGIKQYLSLMET